MNEVKCLGQERSIWNCPFKNITSEDCQHTEDAAVRCNVPYMALENSVRDSLFTSSISASQSDLFKLEFTGWCVYLPFVFASFCTSAVNLLLW